MRKMFDVLVAIIAVLLMFLTIKFQMNGVKPRVDVEPEKMSLVYLSAPANVETPEANPAPTVASTEKEEPPALWSDEEAAVLAKMLWGEAGGVPSDTEKSAVVWTVLNRQDMHGEGIVNIVTMPGQYVGYRESNPVDEHLLWLVEDVLTRWYQEKAGFTDVGRTIPADYIFFSGDGYHNYFRNKFEGGVRWDWSLPSPYST